MNKAIKELIPGDRFHLVGIDTVYRVTRPVRSGSGLTAVTYCVDSDSARYEFEFAKASLTTAVVL